MQTSLNAQHLSVLKQYWGYDNFRGIQKEIIDSISQGKDTLGLMPTGGGKSITFQVPALCQEGTCLVVTPLIALMKDQVRNLKSRGIKAAAIFSGMSHEEIIVTLENCIFGGYKFLYISPERLASDIFKTKMRHMSISFITVDEAHCISQWGYDFRPSYTQIANIREEYPHLPILALTATATPKVVTDIQKQLRFNEGNVFRMSFERKNLSYIVRNTYDKIGEAIHILKNVPGSAILYTRSRRKTKELSELLTEQGFSCTYYHAGLNDAEKDARQHLWQKDTTRIMIATNAFGMGIDKPDVRLVIHMDMPDSIEAYFQEAGRAGRDGKQAYAVLLYEKNDRSRALKRIHDMYPEKDYIKQVYEHLCYYLQMAMGDGFNVTREFHLNEFCLRFKHFPIQADSALKLLDKAGYIEYTEEQDNASRIHFLLQRDDLYKLRDLDPKKDQLIKCLLRNYGGLFSDYIYIDERKLATLTGFTTDSVYHILLSLSELRFLHYIPRKKSPYITFRCKRIEKKEILLSDFVYDDRKKEYDERIKAMISYCESSEICRSSILLHYFGETAGTCQQCDVCRRQLSSKQEEKEKLKETILQFIKTKAPIFIPDIYITGYSREAIGNCLHQLAEEERITIIEGRVSAS